MTTQFDSISTIKSIVAAVHSGHNALEVINTKIADCKKAGLKFGKSIKTCVNRATLQDAMKATFKGTSAKTVANYMTAIVAAVNDGVPFSFSASKGKAKGNNKSETPVEIDAILAKLFSHKDFAGTMSEFETQYLNDEGSLKEIIQSFLESKGYEIKE